MEGRSDGQAGPGTAKDWRGGEAKGHGDTVHGMGVARQRNDGFRPEKDRCGSEATRNEKDRRSGEMTGYGHATMRTEQARHGADERRWDQARN